MKSIVQYRPNEVELCPLQIFFDEFGCRPKFIIKAGASKDYPSSYDDDDEEDRQKLAQRVFLHEEVRKQYKAILEKHKLWIDDKTYVVSYPESHYEHIISVISGNEEKVMFESTVSGGTDPVFTLFGNEKTQLFIELSELLNKIERPVIQKPDMIHLVAVEGNDFWLNAINIKNRQHEFTYDNYNDDFKGVSETVINALRTNKESGLVLFHGGVGTGKTSYMKYLLNQITSKKIIYIPPDMVTHLSSPSFVSFLIRTAKDSILLIEDAETVLQKRKGGQNQSVSNILNISDGILGDILQMQLVCTFNCPIEEIDPALLRPGRLIAEYKFDKLSVEKTRMLLDKLYKSDFGITESMSIAEIYNYKKLPPKTEAKKGGSGKKPRTIVIQSVEKIKNNAN
jgi:hypothetical protein